MKKLLICIVALVFMLGSTFDANAQKRGKGHWNKERKEYAKYHKKREKAFHNYVKHDHRHRGYHAKRDRLRHRHDDWYYGRRFHRHTGYVYFPKYRTYYDPYRRGYVYLRNRAWVFAPTMPSFMVGLDIGALNVQFMANLPL